jgi:hypothetical protein
MDREACWRLANGRVEKQGDTEEGVVMASNLTVAFAGRRAQQPRGNFGTYKCFGFADRLQLVFRSGRGDIACAMTGCTT